MRIILKQKAHPRVHNQPPKDIIKRSYVQEKKLYQEWNEIVERAMRSFHKEEEYVYNPKRY